ncbi:hypothetical protein DBB36_20975 [Flavobacterium sp. WLB]|uniref:hypothetical protein n=1 Tax=unclassified Flavobacterium TaxID=196869 RepID=UPI0006ABAEEA|nr:MULTISPECIES: hypothetical protein [unclassified Flavobacterium]KOP38978.1 hypothetical protein AKO67_08160 [Flavobacterium sp. VMW]OWU89811.1 hypothetical protein APR43_16605 [Flavobacterium sp. NLM]PUU68017.1 hypothetical protein DBB36_20975 [Flavobacterium sp. WLB]
MKKYLTPINIIFVLWGLILQAVSWFYPDYTRYYLYISIIVIIPFAIVSFIKQKEKDRIEGTKEFQASIYRMLFMAVILGIMYFVTYQNHI